MRHDAVYVAIVARQGGPSRDAEPTHLPKAVAVANEPAGDSSAALARAITYAGSKQTYFTARMMVDRELVDDFCRAYAYFRWSDDIVDVAPISTAERLSFMNRQRQLIDRLYRGDRPSDLTPEEQIAADLIRHDRGESSGLQSFIRNMLAVIDFDASRKDRLVSEQELTWYSNTLAKSVTDGIQYFIGHGQPYPDSAARYSAATGAHISHMLRDMVADTANGFINIPREYLEWHGIGPEETGSTPFRDWVSIQTAQARELLKEGRRYLDALEVLRCKTVGHWYCARFEVVLDSIERDRYALRPVYRERRQLTTWLKIALQGASVGIQHMAHMARSGARATGSPETDS